MLPIDLALHMISQAGLFGFYGYCVSVEQHVHIMTACGQYVYVHMNEPVCIHYTATPTTGHKMSKCCTSVWKWCSWLLQDILQYHLHLLLSRI